MNDSNDTTIQTSNERIETATYADENGDVIYQASTRTDVVLDGRWDV